jgi:hypothetical protein
MPVADYFSQDYAAARERFHQAAASAGARLQTYELPGQRGPQQESLSIDVARVGASDADRALVVLSGTHGVEGFCGSGCQVGFFADQLYRALPQGGCALLVHALNPYGFAWSRRVNEDGVDLNRNFVDFSEPLPASADYEPLHEHLVPKDWQGESRRNADLALNTYMKERGARAFQAAVSGGQYTRPTGLFYGGAGPTWSARTLMSILHQQLPATVRYLAVLDLHSGLGPSAYGEPILTPVKTGDAERALRWYRCEVKDISGGDAASPQLKGTISCGVNREFPDLELTFLALEFGTIPMLEVLTALRGDHWLHSGVTVDPSLRASIQSHMRAAFYSETPAWQAAVYGRTADFIYRAFLGLAGSGSPK